MGIKLIPASAYIRMSGQQQQKSPAEQRAEITKLATREHCEIVEWFTDEAITGDSSTDARSGLAALLSAAKAGKFKLVLAWHTNRISREDPMDAIVFYNQLRKAGVGLHTCCEGCHRPGRLRQAIASVRQPKSQQRLPGRDVGQDAQRSHRQRQGRRPQRWAGDLRNGSWTVRCKR